jgi:hypothetical protein
METIEVFLQWRDEDHQIIRVQGGAMTDSRSRPVVASKFYAGRALRINEFRASMVMTNSIGEIGSPCRRPLA